jgi:hypothetical protein
MLFSRFAQSAAALALLTTGFAAPANAQNNKQIISGTWYEDRASITDASNGNAFYVSFSQTRSDKFLNVTNVSCLVQVNTTTTVGELTLHTGSTYGKIDIDRPYTLGSGTTQTVISTRFASVVQNGIFYKFGPGRFPTIYIYSESSNNTFASVYGCTLVGNLTDN